MHLFDTLIFATAAISLPLSLSPLLLSNFSINYLKFASGKFVTLIATCACTAAAHNNSARVANSNCFIVFNVLVFTV